jgi:cytoskeletal protein RodZ
MNDANGYMTMADGPGEFLRRQRELRHISLDEVAEHTKISRRYLEALEDERYDRLPGEAFTRGFIRSYAQCVGLDPEDALLVYNQARQTQEVEEPQSPGLSSTSRTWNERMLLWLLLVGVVIVGGVLMSTVRFLPRPNAERLLSSPHGETTGSLPTATALLLTVSTTADTWLRVAIDDQVAQDLVLRAGQSTKWIGRDRLVLSIGNARAAQLKLNGRDLIIPPSTQSILRHYTISRDLLP